MFDARRYTNQRIRNGRKLFDRRPMLDQALRSAEARRAAEHTAPAYDFFGGLGSILHLKRQHPSEIIHLRPSGIVPWRSEEHTSELQSRGHLVCRLLLEKKN